MSVRGLELLLLLLFVFMSSVWFLCGPVQSPRLLNPFLFVCAEGGPW